MHQPGKVANPARAQLIFPLFPYAPETILHTQAESGPYFTRFLPISTAASIYLFTMYLWSVRYNQHGSPQNQRKYLEKSAMASLLLFLTFSVFVANPEKLPVL